MAGVEEPLLGRDAWLTAGMRATQNWTRLNLPLRRRPGRSAAAVSGPGFPRAPPPTLSSTLNTGNQIRVYDKIMKRGNEKWPLY